jgi:hypothetical protein
MDLKINEYIKEATTRCEKGFSCLNGQKDCLCEIEGSNGSHTVSIKTKGNNSCKYLLPLGSSTYCLCPTRNEIYNKYQF